MDYLLETSTCSFLMAHARHVTAHFDSLSDLNDYLFTCTIVRGEILFGIQRLPIGRRRQVLENQAINLFEGLPCLAVPKEAADYYAPMKNYAEQQGTPLSENDLWIAATAMALDAILVTADSDFQRIAGFGLQLEDWTN
jgi:tRNA(fMet)-specific endonuclease VapC